MKKNGVFGHNFWHNFYENKPGVSGISTLKTPEKQCGATTTTPTVPLKTPEEVRPHPNAEARKKQGGRKPLKCNVLTDTPNMLEIKEHCAKCPKIQEQKRFKKNCFSTKLNKSAKQERRKTLNCDSDSETLSVISSKSSELTDIDDQIRNECEEKNLMVL
ncbi:hypothetical protein QE152_g10024 [Popillia japonica]|uniref:Uncharacterized protein n=1 Tax=Popillia japonica TaxID=7064 RepID=A0AAW1LUT2_POPJA